MANTLKQVAPTKLIEVKNCFDTDVYYKSDSDGKIYHWKPFQSVQIDAREIQAQCYDNCLYGYHGKGLHPTLYICDKALRVQVGYETEDEPQVVIDKKFLAGLFEIKDFEEFKNAVVKYVQLLTEKQLFANLLGTTTMDHARHKWCEEFLGLGPLNIPLSSFYVR